MNVFATILLSFSLVSGIYYESEIRCLLHGQKCVERCPDTMFPYHTNCDKDTMSQRTCSSPITYPIGYTCGWSRCDCINDLFLDEESNTCMTLEACSHQYKKPPRHERHRETQLPTGVPAVARGHLTIEE